MQESVQICVETPPKLPDIKLPVTSGKASNVDGSPLAHARSWPGSVQNRETPTEPNFEARSRKCSITNPIFSVGRICEANCEATQGVEAECESFTARSSAEATHSRLEAADSSTTPTYREHTERSLSFSSRKSVTHFLDYLRRPSLPSLLQGGLSKSSLDLTQLLTTENGSKTAETRWGSVWDSAGSGSNNSSELRVSFTDKLCREYQVTVHVQTFCIPWVKPLNPSNPLNPSGHAFLQTDSCVWKTGGTWGKQNGRRAHHRPSRTGKEKCL